VVVVVETGVETDLAEVEAKDLMIQEANSGGSSGWGSNRKNQETEK